MFATSDASRIAKSGIAALFAAALISGCETYRDPGTGTTEPQTTSSDWYVPDVPAGWQQSGLAFPTGDVDTSALIVHQQMPAEVRRGAEYDYRLYVTNLTKGTLQGVTVNLESTNNQQIVDSEPEAQSGTNNTFWNLGDLGPRQTRMITITARADDIGASGDCLSVEYNNTLCFATTVVEPALSLVKTATPEVLICDPIILTYEVSNTGTGSVDDVVISDRLPSGLTTTAGGNSVNISVGTLAAGETQRFTQTVMADRTGTFEGGATAASGELEAEASEVETIVRQPVLEISSECTERQFVGRNATFEFTVENTGDGNSVNTIVTAPIPGGATFVRASEGGMVDGANVVWNLGTLAPDAERTVSVTYTPSGIGTLTARASVQGVCAEMVSDDCSTRVEGIPAILLEVVDEVDPVEVGTTTTYLIRVTNQGSAADNNIRIVCELPAELSFVSATGATQGSAAGRVITFAPLPSLAAGAAAEWRVTVRAESVGDVRFATEMNSDNLTSPVRETEATNLYE